MGSVRSLFGRLFWFSWRHIQIVPCCFFLVVFFVLFLGLFAVDISFVSDSFPSHSLSLSLSFTFILLTLSNRESEMSTIHFRGWLWSMSTRFLNSLDLFFSATLCTLFFQNMKDRVLPVKSILIILKRRESMRFSTGTAVHSLIWWILLLHFSLRRSVNSKFRNEISRCLWTLFCSIIFHIWFPSTAQSERAFVGLHRTKNDTTPLLSSRSDIEQVLADSSGVSLSHLS